MIFNQPVSSRTFGKLRSYAFCLSVLCALGGYSSAQEWKKVHDGVEYAHVEHKIGNDPVKINLLRLDLKKVRLDVHHALDKAIGLETTSSIAKRKGAVAAINGGFFRLDKSSFGGDASGLLIVDRQILSETKGTRVALALEDKSTNETQASIIGFYSLHCSVEVRKVAAWPIEGINRELRANDSIIYTPEYGSGIETGSESIGIVVKKRRVVRVAEKNEILSIPQDGFVILASGSQRELFKKLSILKQKLSRICRVEAESLPGTNVLSGWNPEDALSGRPQLIKEGKIDITWEQEKASKSFVETRHPRTAVAKLKDGKFLMVTVDGRQPGVSVGMSLQELAEYILSLGATDAMNLDGGGSTTMFLDGKVVNTPSDKEGERKIGDAIVVTLRKKGK